MHERVFAIIDEGQIVECLNWRGRLVGKVNATSLEPSKVSESHSSESERQKIVNFGHTLKIPNFS